MQSIPKRKLSDYKLKVFIVILLVFCTSYFYWLYLHSINIDNQNSSIKQTTPKNQAEKSQPKITAPEPKFTADYTLPPITDGLAPVISTIKSDQPIVFLGIDDGEFKDNSVIDIMKNNNIKASLFLSKTFIANRPDFFKQIISNGSIAENHTLTHDINMIKNQTYQQQKNEICGMADYELQQYGVRPTLYRPPGGAYTNMMRKDAADCGMKAVVTWIAKANGGSMQYQIGNKLRPGDIILMHFRPEFAKDIKAFVDAESAAGLHTELIEDAIQ